MSYNNLVGKTVGDRYRIDEILGQGGMSAVYKAYDPNLKRVVAVKIIHPHLADDPKFLIRFEEEAAAVAQLRHPNIVQVFDFNHDQNLYYMVQEYVPGETLQELLRRSNKSGKRIPVQEAIQYTIDICDAAGYAHQRGMIHRDIKPANIMLDVHGSAILMDFGIVKITGGERHTATGAVVGTALYMPPELIRGEVPDARADVYSLGVTLFEMVSGHPPFEADSAMSLLMMHMRDPLPDMHQLRPEVPEELITVIAKSLAKDQNDRYASMTKLAADLKGVLSHPQASIPASATLIDATPEPDSSGTQLESPVSTSDGIEDKTMSEAQVAGARVAMGLASKSSAPSQDAINDLSPDTPTDTSGDGGSPSSDEPLSTLEDPKLVGRKRIHPAIWIGGAMIFLCVVLGGIGIALAAMWNGGDKDAELVDETAATPLVVAAELDADIPTMTPTASPSPIPSITPLPTQTFTPTLSPTPSISPTPTIPPGIPFVRINAIALDIDANYIVNYETFEFIEELPGTHIHFFFNTVPPEEAGVPEGSGQWKIYGGPRPFSEYKQNQRPVNATQLCALVANPNHSVQAESGNCFDLPDVVLVTPVQDTSCLQGPDLVFPVLTPLFSGQRLQVQGISPDEKWWYVANPNNLNESCWLAQDETTVSGDISTLGLIEPPPLPEGASAADFSVEITEITIDEHGNYEVDYATQGFTEELPGTHLHFFFNTVPPDQVGIDGSGNRLMYGGPSPFTGYKTTDRPAEATQLCVLVTNPDHSVILESGNCLPLPEGDSMTDYSVEITQIRIDDNGSYEVDYITEGFTEELPGMHLHFFFNTVSPDQVGMSGSGDRLMFGGPSPFNGYETADRPDQATQLCVLVTNPDHSVILESGNCMLLPDVPVPSYSP